MQLVTEDISRTIPADSYYYDKLILNLLLRLFTISYLTYLPTFYAFIFMINLEATSKQRSSTSLIVWYV